MTRKTKRIQIQVKENLALDALTPIRKKGVRTAIVILPKGASASKVRDEINMKYVNCKAELISENDGQLRISRREV